MNLPLASAMLALLKELGVGEMVLGAGARNSPFIALLSAQSEIKHYFFFEERSAAFFALGRIKRTLAPVAVFTTSGTAVAELLPAVIEAYYTRLPLILVTADRPHHYRGSGAPQTIEQKNIFSHYTPPTWDIASISDLAKEISITFPFHFNIAFDEPLLDGQSATRLKPPAAPSLEFRFKLAPRLPAAGRSAAIKGFLATCPRPLAIVGGLEPKDRLPVLDFLQALQFPVYAEAVSGLRQAPELAGQMLIVPDHFWGEERFRMHFDSVLRIGGVPTLRLWRDLEKTLNWVPVLHLTSQGFRGLTRGELVGLDQLEIPGGLAGPKIKTSIELGQMRDALQAKINELLERFPLSEPAWFRWLSYQIPEHDVVYLGNSLPIREWDQFASLKRCWPEVHANRGANGIDGQLSTFLGLVDRSEKKHWAILGDLTTLYDLSAPQVLPQLSKANFKLLVINNGGGKIFRRLFGHPDFENQHQIRFEGWAKMWNLDYQLIQAPAELGAQVIEILPDERQTEEFWKALS